MAEFTLGEAALGTAVDMSGLKAGVDDAEGIAQSGFSKIGDIIGGALKVGIAAAAGGFLALGGAIVSRMGDAREAAQIMAQTEAVIKSTGGAAGYTAQQIADMAGALSAAEGKSLFGDSDIQKGQNLLLTFTNITETLPDATQTMVDMAQAMGTDVSGGAIQLGKALNDPINGISALTRVGVTFTEEQKAQIAAMQEAGDMAGAQKVILAELNKEFGGSAEAAAKADGGMTQFKDRLGEIAEGIGGSLLPLLNQFMGFMNETLLPVVEEIGGQLATAFQTGDFSGLLSSLADLGGNLGTMFSEFAERAGQWILDALPGFLTNAQTFFQGMADWVTESAPGWASALGGFAAKAITWIADALPGVADSLGQLYNTMINWVVDSLPGWIAQLQQLGLKAIQWIQDALPGLGTNLGQFAGKLLGWIVQTAIDVVPKLAELAGKFLLWVATEVLPKLPGVLLTIATALYNFISEIVKEVGPKLAILAGKFLDWVKTDVIPYLAERLDAIKGAIGTWVNERVTWAKNELARIGAAIVAGIRAGVEGAWAGFLAWIDQQIEKIPKAVRDLLGIGSPSKVFAEIGGYIIAGWLEGMQGSFPDLLRSFQSMGDELADLAEKIRDVVSSTMADIFSSGADVFRQRAENREFIADLGKTVAEENRKVQKDIQDTRDKIAKEREKDAPDMAKIQGLEAELALLQQQADLLAESTQQMGSFRKRQAELLTAAEQTAAALFKDDPARQADFFKLRSRQLQEAAKLEEEWFAARTQADRDRIQAQMNDIRKAQELELAAFMQQAQQGNATFGDLFAQYEDLQKQKTDLQEQIANEEDQDRKAELQAQLDNVNAFIAEIEQALAPLQEAGITPTTGAPGTDILPTPPPFQGVRGLSYPALPNVNGLGAAQMAGLVGSITNNNLEINIDARDAMDPDAVERSARRAVDAALREAGWRGDTRGR